MNKNIFEIAAITLNISIDDAMKYYKEIPSVNGYYFWNPVRGGASVIIDQDGEKLTATSIVSFERHLNAFKNGKRN